MSRKVTELSKKMGRELKERRVRKGYTIKYVSKKTGICPLMLLFYENGLLEPDLCRIFSLLKLYEVNTRSFFNAVE